MASTQPLKPSGVASLTERSLPRQLKQKSKEPASLKTLPFQEIFCWTNSLTKCRFCLAIAVGVSHVCSIPVDGLAYIYTRISLVLFYQLGIIMPQYNGCHGDISTLNNGE